MANSLFATSEQARLLALEPYLGIIVDPLIRVLHKTQETLMALHPGSALVPNFQVITSFFKDLALNFVHLGEALRRHPETFGLVERHTPCRVFKNIDEMRENVELILSKPHKYGLYQEFYGTTFLVKLFTFLIVQLCWFHGGFEGQDMTGLANMIHLLWGMYQLDPVAPQCKPSEGPPIIEGNRDRLAYAISIINQIMLYVETSSFHEATDMQNKLLSEFRSWLSGRGEPERISIDLVTYNVLMNPLRIKQFGKAWKYKDLVTRFARFIKNGDWVGNADISILALQEVNDVFSVDIRSHLAKTLKTRDVLPNTFYSPGSNGKTTSSGTFTASSFPSCKTHHESIVFPDLFTLPKPGDVIKVGDLLFHGCKDLMVQNDFIMTQYPVTETVQLTVINVHLISGEDFNSCRKRKFQLKKILEYILTFESTTPIIVIGDFNQSPSDTVTMIKELGYPESYLKSLTTVDAMITFPTFKGKRIDYCIYNSRNLELWDASPLVSRDHFESDHSPISFRFNIK